MSAPKVSVIIPTFNRAPLLPRAIDSIRAQTFTDWEIILVDDGSTDDTAQLAQRYAGQLGDRFQYIHQSNAGSSAARNRGLDAARGQFVAFLDSDDEFLPQKLERQLELFDRCPQLGLVYCDSSFITLQGVRRASVFDTKAPQARRVPYRQIAPNLCLCTDTFMTHLLTDYFVSTISGLVRREILADQIRFPVGYAYAEEWMFYLRVARVAPAGFVNEPLCLHHFTAGSLSRRDPAANVAERLRLLELMRSEFSDLGGTARRILRKHLSHAHHQLAFHAHRRRSHREAARQFVHSFRFEPRLTTLLDVLQSTLASFRAA